MPSLEEERHFETTDSELFRHCVLCIILQLPKFLRADWLVAIVRIQTIKMTSDVTRALFQSKHKANSARTFCILLLKIKSMVVFYSILYSYGKIK